MDSGDPPSPPVTRVLFRDGSKACNELDGGPNAKSQKAHASGATGGYSKPMKAALLSVALALSARPASAQHEALRAAFEAARAGAFASRALQVPQGRPVLRLPAPAEPARPDEFDANDSFRLRLLSAESSERWLVWTQTGDILLIVEKGYLPAAALDRLCADLQQAAAAVPRLTGRAPRVRGRVTVYVYDEGPMSEADVPGARPGEKGLMLRFVREGADPLFHEMTHLLAGHGGSQSLNEGIAEWVQARLRPGRASAFIPAGTDPHGEAARALASYPSAFRDAIGAPGHFRWSVETVRRDFYYASWSFADFLLRRGGMSRYWSVLDAGGTPAAYRAAYGRSREDLVDEWAREIALRPGG